MAQQISKRKKAAVFERCAGCCAYCGQSLTQQNAHIDHIQPKSTGGGNELENLNLACASCNTSKSDKTLEDYRLLMMIRSSEFKGVLTPKLWRELLNRGVFINLPVHHFYFDEVAP